MKTAVSWISIPVAPDGEPKQATTILTQGGSESSDCGYDSRAFKYESSVSGYESCDSRYGSNDAGFQSSDCGYDVESLLV